MNKKKFRNILISLGVLILIFLNILCITRFTKCGIEKTYYGIVLERSDSDKEYHNKSGYHNYTSHILKVDFKDIGIRYISVSDSDAMRFKEGSTIGWDYSLDEVKYEYERAGTLLSFMFIATEVVISVLAIIIILVSCIITYYENLKE
jgi:hypothetical protein